MALVIVGLVGISFAAAATENLAAVRRARASGELDRAASEYLATVTLWPIEDLDRRLGMRRNGPWFLHIEREAPGLYIIALLDTARTPLLETAVFRPDTIREP